MLRHAAYRQERPYVALMADVASAALRPRGLVVLILTVLAAAEFGVPVNRAVPGPVKDAYADGRAWQTRNAAKVVCHDGHRRALRSGGEQELAMAAQRCDRLGRTYGR